MMDLTWDTIGAITSSMLMVYYIRTSHESRREQFFKPFVRIVSAKKGIEN